MKRLGLVFVLLVVGCAGVAQSGWHKAFLPWAPQAGTVDARRAWAWPQHGYGYANVGRVPVAALGDAGWFQTWWAGCAPRQVPLVWNKLEGAAVWRCNDGRPVLVLNEPERAEQANLSPAAAADVLHAVIAGGWRGEVYCCGTWADQLAYNAAVVAAYEARYGPWPATGWHIHVYSGGAWARDIHAPERVGRALAQVRNFIAAQRAAGYLGRGVVISEYGVLSSRAWHQPQDLVPAFLAYEAGFKTIPEVLTWAWFATHTTDFSASDLLEADGRLTALGQVWLGVSR